ncbi:hypothetical protein RJ639_016935 [Escallonia herrerae]|uniref:Uncharacterized protein n=1 Tax=Escallonia herrerae TaxID=1293975 RepID=A0AA89AK88_9ASTE|nr:hypothetical protein RJ639_016935 [Escallonia herrerae]
MPYPIRASRMAGYQATNPESEATHQVLLHNSIAQIFKACSERKPQPSSNASIYRVPRNLRELNESAYTPHIVSIGPYHKHSEHLKDMEDHQISYMHSFLSRIRPKPNQSAEDATKEIANKMLEKVADARSCYEATDKPYDDARFAEMLLIDGCFILELLYRRKVNYPRDGDPILGNALVHLDVKHDLLLLENQIPMFVLQTLFDFILGESHSLPDLIISFFGNMLYVDHEFKLKMVVRTQTAAHILGLLHDCYMPCGTAASEQQSTNQSIKHSAIDLFGAGVQFTEERFLRNLIALEQCSPGIRQPITSYAFLMDILVNTKDDVEVLEKAGVLENNLGASKDAVRLFNNMKATDIQKNETFRCSKNISRAITQLQKSAL